MVSTTRARRRRSELSLELVVVVDRELAAHSEPDGELEVAALESLAHPAQSTLIAQV